MDFMISLFGSDQTGKPRLKKKHNEQFAISSDANGCAHKKSKVKKHSRMSPEEEEGNVEYKLKLIEPSHSRFEHLVTQLKWRLREGQGEAFYEIGVADDGLCAGLTPEEMTLSLATLNRMAERLGASVKVLREREIMVDDEAEIVKTVAEVLVRRIPDNQEFIDLRVAVLGAADAGKSTLLGVITQGEVDNGRGRARLNLFRHLHEIQTGRTSSISLDLVGFDSAGQMVTHRNHSVEEILENSSKLVTFIDLAGHEKYLKTTIFGLTGYKPHFALLVVPANKGVVGTTREHLGLAMALEVPVFVVISKLDLARPPILARTLAQLESLIKGPGCRRIPVRIQSLDDVYTTACNFNAEKVVPLFVLSSVTGDNVEFLTEFLNVLPATQCQNEKLNQLQNYAEFRIDEIFNVQHVGTVAAGLLSKGVIQEGEHYLVGPSATGEFHPVTVDSIHRNKAQCRLVQAGQAAALSLSGDLSLINFRKGLAVVDARSRPLACLLFEADMFVLYHPAEKLCIGFQCTVHIGNVCQTASIVWMSKKHIKTNDNARVRFKFIKQPECIHEGSRVLFRERRTKGIGNIVKVFPLDEDGPT